MKISELKSGMNNITVSGKVMEVSEPRTVQTKYGSRIDVATATLEDDSGQVKLTLWGKRIGEVKAGDEVEVKNGFVKDFKGELQLSLAKDGELNVAK